MAAPLRILILNGPNLNYLGRRQPHLYGNQPFDAYLQGLREAYPAVVLDYFQSNHEGALIDKLQEADGIYDGILLNAGGLTHTSVALADAVASISPPVVEVHLTNTFAREPFRHHSFLSPVCSGVIAGFGLQSYELALRFFLRA